MKRITLIETLVLLAIAVPAFAAWTCVPNGSDYDCTETYTTTINTTESLAGLNAKIDNRVAAKSAKIEENTRDATRGANDLTRINEDLASLRARKAAIKNATGIE